MRNRIKINCKKVYDNGNLYEKSREEIISIQKNLNAISEEIRKIWGGADGNNFAVSLNKHIKNFDAVVNFLGFNGDLLKKNALTHNNIDNTFITKVERSELDEQ